ncbi:MAG: 4a-hydroxytetrahydrobiopterin dehydratase [Isosphaeraceae bacterium]|nr:4a-hydroxytetrahydrobiopterin dehydratase [Isosphaeraceae bacterium]
MPKLAFLSYRRSDAPQAARGLYAQLRSRFGSSHVFMDVAAITPGSPWPDRITRSLEKTSVLLAVIGPSWLRAADKYGRRRLDSDADWVRKEIHLALSNSIPIIPILVAGVSEPPPQESLPDALRDLLNSQAIRLRDDKWDEDFDELVRTLVTEHGFVDNEKRVVLPQPRVQIEPLTEQELGDALLSLPGWEPVESLVPGDYPKSRQEIRKIFRFKSFKSAIEFMYSAIQPINKIPHHPRWENQWRTVTVYLTTWDIGNKVTALDVELARVLDNLYDSSKASRKKTE